MLHVAVVLAGAVFEIDVGYFKSVKDLASGDEGPAMTWTEGGSSGPHAGDEDLIVRAVVEHVDDFIAAYLHATEGRTLIQRKYTVRV